MSPRAPLGKQALANKVSRWAKTAIGSWLPQGLTSVILLSETDVKQWSNVLWNWKGLQQAVKVCSQKVVVKQSSKLLHCGFGGSGSFHRSWKQPWCHNVPELGVRDLVKWLSRVTLEQRQLPAALSLVRSVKFLQALLHFYSLMGFTIKV